MKIELLGWESRGFRSPDISVDLLQGGATPRVALIQMPNGTGKTTTLNLLRAALTGHATAWSGDRIRSFKKKDSALTIGKFAVHLMIDTSMLTIELQLDFEQGTAIYRTSHKAAGGVLAGWKPPATARRFLTEQFVKLFVFDGELAERLLDPKEHEAEQAIDALFQLYLFEQIQAEAEGAWERATQDKTGKTSRAKTGRENRLKDLHKRLSKLEKAKREGEKKSKELQQRYQDLETQIQERIDRVESLRQQREEAEERHGDAKGKVEELTKEVMTSLRSPETVHTAFAEQIYSLKGSLDTLKLPATTSRQFFIELLEQTECICGHTLDEAARERIAERSSAFLGAETSGFLNTLKHDIDKYLGTNPREAADNMKNLRDRLVEAINDRSAASGELRAIREQLIKKGDEEVERLEREKENVTDELDKLNGFLSEINRNPEPDDLRDPETLCLKALRKQVDKVKQEVAEITQTVTLRKQIDILNRLLVRAQERARADLRQAILSDCRERLQAILAYNPVEIASIDGALRLKNQEGASVGQTLAVAYTFLTTLLGRGQHQFPLVVDSPANPIDHTVRSEVAKIIPHLTTQFIAFTISTERPGFTDYLHAAAGGDVRYLTLFRKNEHTANLLDELPQSGVSQTEDGVLVDGRAYFNAFDDKRLEED